MRFHVDHTTCLEPQGDVRADEHRRGNNKDKNMLTSRWTWFGIE